MAVVLAALGASTIRTCWAPPVEASWFTRSGLMSAVADPSKAAEPKLKMPPSAATSQYPAPPGPGAMPSMGSLSRMEPVEPWKDASP